MLAGSRCLLLEDCFDGGVAHLVQPLCQLGAHVSIVSGGKVPDNFGLEKIKLDGSAPDFVFADPQALTQLLKKPAALTALGTPPEQLPRLLVGVTADLKVFAPPQELLDGESVLKSYRTQAQREGVTEFSLPVAQLQANSQHVSGSNCAPADSMQTNCVQADSETYCNISVLTSQNPNWQSANPQDRIAWAARGMPITAKLASELAQQRSLNGERILVSLVLEPKTAALAIKLLSTGAQIAVFAAVSETDPGIAAALADAGVQVFAATSKEQLLDPELDAAHAAAALAWQPHWLIDDGAHLIRLAHTEYPTALKTLKGAAEETTSGIRPLLEMVATGELRVPVVAVNNAATKTLFDNRVGTGESCVIAALDLITSSQCAQQRRLARVVVYGYGPVGQGCARVAQSFGLTVSVIEPDPVRALSAVVDGYTVGNSTELLSDADLVISATGVWNTVSYDEQSLMRPGTYICVAGGIDGEVAEPLASGLCLLADGGGINYTAGEGNPLEVMDLSFATQVAALRQLLETAAVSQHGGQKNSLAPGVYPVNDAAVALVAKTALQVRGCALANISGAQRVGGASQPWRVHRYKKNKLE